MIKIKDFKEWSSNFNNVYYNEMSSYFEKFPDTDKRNNRIYFKLDVAPSDKIHIPAEISEFLGWKNISIVDYEAGLCRKNGVGIRIGKALSDFGQDHLLNTYAKSKEGLKKVDNLTVVISRHPYDLMGISTNRGWSTCLDLNDKKYNGLYSGGLKTYLKSGYLSSYLIRDNDRNINNPISRILIKKYGIELSSDGICYGTYVDEYSSFVNKFVREYNIHARVNYNG